MSGHYLVYETNDWKPLPIVGSISFNKPVTAADWTLDSKFLAAEDANQRVLYFKISANSVKCQEKLDSKVLSELAWKNGSLFSSWQVLSD